MKNRKRNDKGFTIVELMVGIIISSILAITTGMMLYLSSSGWRRNSVAVELQRDATVIIDMFSRTIRPAKASDIILSGSTLTIGNKSFSLVGGNSIRYDPDIGVPGDEITVINGKVAAITIDIPPNLPNTVIIGMTLTYGSESITINPVTIGCRN